MNHIAIITTSFPLSSDGSEAAGSFVVDFARILSQLVKITIIAPGNKTCREVIDRNFAVERYRAPYLPLSLLNVYKLSHWPAIMFTLNEGMKVVNSVLQKENIDHILALWVLPSGFWAKKASERFQIPFSTWALGSDIWNLGKVPLVSNVLKNVLKSSSLNFADGLKLALDVKTLSGRDCIFMPSSRELNLPAEKKLSEKPRYKLTFLGRWHRNKGVDLLLNSLSLLQNSDWKLIHEIRICGGGPMDKQVTDAVLALQSQGYPLTMQGYLNKEEASHLLLWTDYLLIPSRVESIPVIFSDAMKCKCPVVCMPVGDLPKLISDYHVGTLSSDVSAKAFKNAISEILQRPPIVYEDKLTKVSEIFNLDKISKNFLISLQKSEMNARNQ